MDETGTTGGARDGKSGGHGAAVSTVELERVGNVPLVTAPSTLGDAGGPPPRLLLRAVVVLLVAVVVGGGVGWLVHRQTPTYKATALVEMDQPLQLITNGDQVVLKLSRLRLKYAPLVGTDAILQPLSSSLGVPIERLRGSVSAQVPIDNLLIVVTATTNDAASAREYANGAADGLSRYVATEQEQLGVPSKQMYEAVVIDQARGAAKTSPTTRRTAEAGLIFGSIAGVLAYAGLRMLRDRSAATE